MLTNTTLSRYLRWNPSRLGDVRTHVGGSRDLPNMDYEPGKSKWLLKENWKTCLYKWFKLPRRHNSGILPLSLPECLSTHTVCFFLLINALFASLLSVFVEILFCNAEGPGPLSLTTNLVARVWCFHYCNLASVFGWEPKPHSSLCRPRPPKIVCIITKCVF